MPKSISIFCGRQSQYGDVIAYLPFLNYLEQKSPNSYKVFSLAKKCSQIAPLLLNHSLIDRIQITTNSEGWHLIDEAIADGCDIVFNPNPILADPFYYNQRDLIEETFLMNYILHEDKWKKVVGSKDWNELPDKYPRLTQWFDVERKSNTIGLLPFAGYENRTKNRSPSVEWWQKMIPLLKDYKLIHFGHPSNPKFGIEDATHLNLFDTVKGLLSCDLILGSDSGLQWMVGAYGHPQIVLYSNYLVDHVSNFDAFVPSNCKNNLVAIPGINDINRIKQEEVLEKVKEMI